MCTSFDLQTFGVSTEAERVPCRKQTHKLCRRPTSSSDLQRNLSLHWPDCVSGLFFFFLGWMQISWSCGCSLQRRRSESSELWVWDCCAPYTTQSHIMQGSVEKEKVLSTHRNACVKPKNEMWLPFFFFLLLPREKLTCTFLTFWPGQLSRPLSDLDLSRNAQ